MFSADNFRSKQTTYPREKLLHPWGWEIQVCHNLASALLPPLKQNMTFFFSNVNVFILFKAFFLIIFFGESGKPL